MSALQQIIDQLKTQEEQLAKQRATMQQRLIEVEAELTRITDAIAALDADAKKKTKNGKPSPKKDVVRDAVRSCLTERGALHPEELKNEVAKRIAAQGFSRAGLALRLSEVLDETEFPRSEDGLYSLAERHDALGSGQAPGS